MDRRRSRPRAVPLPRMPTASGVECVRVLVGFGWMAMSWTEAECVLERGPYAITVPLEPALPSAVVDAIAGAAGIAPFVFVDAIERRRTPLPPAM